MSRFSPIDLASYPVGDVLEVLSFEAYLARDRSDLQARWEARRVSTPSLPAFDTLFLESDPSSVVLEVGSTRELLLRARVNDALRSLTLAGAFGRKLDHIGVTYYRTPRRTGEDNETYRQRLAIAPESWSTAGPVGAYVFHALSAHEGVLDVAAYSEDEGVTLSPHIRVVVLVALDADAAAVLAAVRAALADPRVRPFADFVSVELATPLAFGITATLTIRSGASAALVIAEARDRLTRYCQGRRRYAGDDVPGPVYLVGRTFRPETLAGIAMGGDANIVEVDIDGAGINLPHPSYTPLALLDVGRTTFVPLADAMTAHLFTAPILDAVTIQHEIAGAGTGWAG
jgi:phage-related baseplate assembly protein